MEVETMNEERQIYEKIEIEAEKGTNFEILNATTKGKLVIIVKKNKAGIYSENYMYPPILDGYNLDGFLLDIWILMEYLMDAIRKNLEEENMVIVGILRNIETQ